MNINKNNVEQPQNQDLSQGEASQQTNGQENFGIEGSTFKTPEALLNSYKTLQADYTKKCQRLAEVEKILVDNKNNFVTTNQQSWQEEVDKFLEDNINARDFKGEITNLVLSDKEVQNATSPLEVAWSKIAKQSIKSPKDLVNDPKFLQDYIFNNEQVKTQIINEYFKNINLKSSPTLVSSALGASTPLTPPKRPKSLEEATQIAKELFK